MESLSDNVNEDVLPGDRGPGCLIIAIVWVIACFVFMFITRIWLPAVIASVPLALAIHSRLVVKNLLRKNYDNLAEEDPLFSLLRSDLSTQKFRVYVAVSDLLDLPTLSRNLNSIFLSSHAMTMFDPTELKLLIECHTFEFKRPHWLKFLVTVAFLACLILSFMIYSLNNFALSASMSALILIMITVTLLDFMMKKHAFIEHFSKDGKAERILNSQQRLKELAPANSRLKNKWQIFSDSNFESIWLKKIVRTGSKPLE